MVPDGTLNLDIAVDLSADMVTVRLSGDLDISTAPRLIATIGDLASHGAARIEVDCSAVDFVDSAGIRALIVGRNEASQRGTNLELTSCSQAVRRVLDMTGLTSLLATSAVH